MDRDKEKVLSGNSPARQSGAGESSEKNPEMQSGSGKALEKQEKAPAWREKELGPFSSALKERKEELYDKVKVSEKTLTAVIRVVYVLLGIVVLLIIMEAAGIFKL